MAPKKKAARKEAPAPKPRADQLPEVDTEEEFKKLQGTTPAQKENTAYHKGAFQTHDPVTGLKRDKPLS